MTLTHILPSLRRTLADPLVGDHWPEFTAASPEDVTIAGISLLTLVQWCGTPCVHTAAAVIPGTNGRPSANQLASVVVTRVDSVTAENERLVVWIDAELDRCDPLIGDTRMIGRASTAHTVEAVIFGPTPHSAIHRVPALPGDLAVGDLLVIPCRGVTRLHDVRGDFRSGIALGETGELIVGYLDDPGSAASRPKATSARGAHRERATTPLEGLHRWGIVELPDPIRTARSGIARYSLQVFPPGTNTEELRPLLFLRRWRVGGTIGALGLEMILGSLWPGWDSVVIIVCSYVLVLWYAVAASAKLRRRIRRLAVVRIHAGDDAVNREKLAVLSRYLNDLRRLDERLRTGDIDEVRYEAGWASVYDAIAEHEKS